MISPFRLHRMGVIGMNQRNAAYISRYNQRRFYTTVDDKLATKTLAQKAGIAVPELYGVIETNHDIKHLMHMIHDKSSFAVKPARGSGGSGILVITDRHKDRFVRTNGEIISLSQLEHHISNILSGLHSLGGQPDKAIVEYRVNFDPVFEDISYRGVPDIRTIVFRGVPAMAMIRLPTRQSDGKANLHMGAIGTGVDLASGTTCHAVANGKIVEEHPDTLHTVTGIRIPHWDNLLTLAARSRDQVNLDYVGVDIVLDKDRGPLMLEYNARPGLSIQLANGIGLLHRLRKIETIRNVPHNAKKRAELAKVLFEDSQYFRKTAQST